MNKLVSAIITTHNRIDLLPRAIKSVLNQTYPFIECIVIDDASNDNTQKYCEQISSIKYIKISPSESKGGNYARNIGINNAKGDYIAFLDDDDYWEENKIEEQYSLAIQKRSDIIYCLRKFENFTNNQITYTYEKGNINNQGDLSNKIFRHYITSTSCLFIARNLLVKINGFDEKLKMWQEYELMIRLAQISNIYYVPKQLVVYRNITNPQRISGKYDNCLETIKYIYRKHKQTYNKLPCSDQFYFQYMAISELYHRSKQSRKYYVHIILFPFYMTYKIIEKTFFNIINKQL